VCDFTNSPLSEFDKSNAGDGEPYYTADCECIITYDGKSAVAQIKWKDIVLGSEKIMQKEGEKRYSF
jgi:hypothetical protein